MEKQAELILRKKSQVSISLVCKLKKNVGEKGIEKS